MASKKISRLKTGVFSRQMKLAKMIVQSGAQAAATSFDVWMNQDNRESLTEEYLKKQARLWADELGQLKGSAMKVGQMLSVYGEHFLPPKANEFLRTLQKDSPAVDWAVMKKQLHQELGSQLEALVVDPTPIGTASIGQVHKAQHKSSGQWLALKIQYPGVDKAVHSDLKALKTMLQLAKLLPKSERTDSLFAEVNEMLNQEMDYTCELRLMEQYRSHLAGNEDYLIPKTFPEFCSQRVLATEYIEGVSVTSPELGQWPQERRNKVAEIYLKLYLEELFSWALVQTDPHVGNYLIKPGPHRDQLVLFDFGATRNVEPEFIEPYRQLVLSAARKDRSQLMEASEKIGFVLPEDSDVLRQHYIDLCDLIVEPFMDDIIYDFSDSDLPKRVVQKGRDLISAFHLRVPPHQTMFLDRKLGGSFTFLSLLGAKIAPRKWLEPYL
ncbi:MAG: AarF/ABC1/UbiB kinase family protein [Pseudobdellovibrionaceae bacterium]|nr:AarF/ABC1/UbiB kinase family protein [Bdellovibrionales bacterium]USN48417.1 MAG: AarF/ABC1/UbiB kinase family protein [Pseudobdellovibrionaceae bacterium]